ncbi:Uncharacterised protein [Mycobacteroides abscessus subsp. massiliense]|uniref:hypothetical protein n=1 Tax=Mycobacteroides abscessus TaxID=36809 RepID=UPI0009A6A755|nr:hypothetical protein [Mycobacteroides abscessus]SKH53597.1 Uncharacterised protein [Mycobacteroides abscessus subsp. massiliense]SKH84211.1 Uncharacterised protein [Mycobacteroides abscessus subsp. massiliense]SKK33576.1 Uncharacterised protein [Mycobacteroides abscessus subsp. massiliense]SKK45801.1 Uncharacterised protein [Mycobacteroides abscessus subsp. massiliense]SKL87394.1 Uncharacterised protein [Mycobacteroides abscessus subsp. massiliense]
MTSNEIAQRSESALELLPPARVPSTTARNMLLEHAQNMDTAHQLAKAMVRTQMVPRRFFGKADDAAAAILYGAELGLNPIQSLQRVVPIHGMPSLEARTMVGLLKSRGHKIRTVEQSDTSVTVQGESPDGEQASSTWTIERAIQAGYVPTPSSDTSLRRPSVDEDWVTVTKTWDGKAKVSVVGNMKYITDPQTMLKAKAQAEVCRELAPDVLMGISYTREELESEDQRQFDRMDERGAVPARVTTARVTEDEIFAEEVPLSSDGIAGDNPPTAAQAAPETPAGDATPEPSPAAQPTDSDPAAPRRDSGGDREATAEADHPAATADRSESKKPAAAGSDRKAPAKKAAPRNVSKLRAPLEKRLFALLGDAGIAGDQDRDGRIAVYRSITGRADVESTNDLDDVTVGKVCDQLYVWQQQNELDDQIAGILSDAAREAEETSAATAADPTTEGNQ